MAKKKLSDYFLYRQRFLLTTIFIFVALSALLYCAVITPAGITLAEQASVTHALAEKGFIQIDSPYYLLQKTSIDVFGLSVTTIKLPSIAIAAVSAIGLFALFRRWLAPSTALFGSLIIFSATTFLSLAGTGSPMILYVVYPVLLLLFGTRIAAHDRISILFAVLLVMTLAAALLTPAVIYLVVLAVLIGMFNPHIRYGFRSLRSGGILLLAVGFICALAPVSYLVLKDPAALPILLAVPQSLSISTLGGNVHELYAVFGKFLHPGIHSGIMTPMVGLSAVGLLTLGTYRLFKGIYSARSQFLLGWVVIAGIVVLLNPQLVMFVYLPIAIIAVFGLGQLIAIWYRTFPLNPYARFSAMIPIGILISGIVIGSTLRYVNTSRYANGAAELYSQDLTLLNDYLAQSGQRDAVTLAVAGRDVDFYKGVNIRPVIGAAHSVNVISNADGAAVKGMIISSMSLGDRGTPIRILTDSRSGDADRFYVYQ